ncbi:hypothetical protein F506_19830 [Herbaspirillum hiltneri N3]|uniref:Uncharacterized protein n=1 Tax=Herbaspirillum hiltneri N3 TaxID=1262470 RepID=A0ABN4I0T2_9BURK|nr:hypothetical protein F506_19830 [Herbaspirillum hiltneri N3]
MAIGGEEFLSEVGALTQLCQCGVQCMRNAKDIQYADIALTSFNFTHVTSINLCEICECFLGEANILPMKSYRRSEGDEISIDIDFRRGSWHAVYRRSIMQ